MDAIERFAAHVSGTRWDDLPPEAVAAAKTFVLDTLGVGAVGSAGPKVAELIDAASAWGGAGPARAWVRGTPLQPWAAAMVNAYQVHNSEFDCIHEAAVVHPMTVVLAAALAEAERTGGVSGRDLILAVALGVDVACHIGAASRARMRFFRPGTAGAFGATAALGRLRGFDAKRLVNALSIAYAQLCGTMQAHHEGSMLLGFQIGFNARNAVMAADLAERGLDGPKGVLEGPYGFFALFEGEHALRSSLDRLGRAWRIAEVAHKPFPSGRATHGVVDAALRLRAEHGIEPAHVRSATLRVPPLVHQLVGRPVAGDMSVNYARLCARFVTAVALERGVIGVEDFRPDRLADSALLALAGRIAVEVDDNPDPNALAPVAVEIETEGGERYATIVETVYGAPANPMSRADQVAKLRRNWQAATPALDPAAADALVALVDGLEGVPDVRALVDALMASTTSTVE